MDNQTDNLDLVEKLISQKYKNDTEKSDFIKKVIDDYYSDNTDKTLEDLIGSHSMEDKIEEILIKTKTKDDGGIIAMSGFYYQLLLTIQYVFEMFEGKWSKVMIDHHQDIIVYNNEVVRVIQVKTRNENICTVTETKAHLEWIPKLLATQKVLDDSSLNVKVEFELISNCLFTKGKNKCVDFENYYENESFSNSFSEKKESLYQSIKDISSKYELEEGEIRKGLEHFKVTERKTENLKNYLYTKIGEQFNAYSRANDDIINMIISYLFEKCFNPSDVSIQIVNNADIDTLKAKISAEFQRIGEKSIQENSMVEILGDFIETTKNGYSHKTFAEEINSIIGELEKEVMFFIKNSKNDDLLTILSRYLSRTTYDTTFRTKNQSAREKEFNRILNILLLIKIYLNGNILFDSESNKLLIVSCENKQKASFFKFNLFGVKKEDSLCLDDVLMLFCENFKNFSVEEQMALISNPKFKVIISGSYDNYGIEKDGIVEVEYKDIPKINFQIDSDEDESDTSIARVKYTVNYIEGEDGNVERIHKMKGRYGSIDSIKESIEEVFKL